MVEDVPAHPVAGDGFLLLLAVPLPIEARPDRDGVGAEVLPTPFGVDLTWWND